MKHITSPDNSFYKELNKLFNSAKQRGKSGQTLLDGVHLLSACLASGNKPLHVIVTASALQDDAIKSLLSTIADVPQTLLDDGLFAGLTNLKTVTGLISLIAVPQAEVHAEMGNFSLLLENIQDPGNLGSMLRSAAAAGCEAVFMSTGCADAWSPKVLRAAMGGHFILKLHEHVDLTVAAQDFDGTIFAATLSASTSLYKSQLTGKIAFAIGNEGAGLSQALLNITKSIIIPMPGKVESLNAAAAAAICLFEAVRQRK